MLPSLCVSQIGAIVLVNCKTQAAFEASNVVLEEVRVFVEVDSLKRKLSEALSSVGIRC